MEYADKGSLRENMEGLTMEQNVSCLSCAAVVVAVVADVVMVVVDDGVDAYGSVVGSLGVAAVVVVDDGVDFKEVWWLVLVLLLL